MSIEVNERPTTEVMFSVDDVLGNALTVSPRETAGPFKADEQYRVQLAPHADDVRIIDDRGDEIKHIAGARLVYSPNEAAEFSVIILD